MLLENVNDEYAITTDYSRGDTAKVYACRSKECLIVDFQGMKYKVKLEDMYDAQSDATELLWEDRIALREDIQHICDMGKIEPTEKYRIIQMLRSPSSADHIMAKTLVENYLQLLNT